MLRLACSMFLAMSRPNIVVNHKHSLSDQVTRYHVPEHIQPHIDFIKPGIALMTTRTTHVDPEKRASELKERRAVTLERRAGTRTINKAIALHGPVMGGRFADDDVNRAVAGDLWVCLAGKSTL